MKETKCCTDVSGENFAPGVEEGYKVYAETAGPFKRDLAYIGSRKRRLQAENADKFRDYDETNAVTQS